MESRKKIRKNIIAGIVGLIISTGLGIVLPRLMLTNYGSEINGLLTSVTNIFAYIAIVEAGVAAASCQALYKSISDNDRKKTNEVLAATNRYYRRTGVIYLTLVLIFSLVYPFLITTEIPYHTIFLVILFNGLGNVINYFYHGKYLIFLKADGKTYVRTGIETVINVLKQVSKIVLIAIGFDVVLTQLAAMIVSFVQMFIVVIYVKRNYSWIDLKVKPDLGSIAQSRYVLVHEISYLISANIDVVVLTFFFDLKTVSVFSIYALLYGIISKVLRVIRDACEFRLAYQYHENRQIFSKMFSACESLYMALTCALFTIVHYFILPFLKIYTHGVYDVNYIQASLPTLFLAISMLEAIRYPSETIVYITGSFKQTQRSAIIESTVNVLLSVVLGYRYGIIGVLCGTLLAQIYRANYLVLYVNKHILNKKPFKTYVCWIVYTIASGAVILLSRYINTELGSYSRIVLVAVPYSVIVLLIYFVIAVAISPGLLSAIKEFPRRKKQADGE